GSGFVPRMALKFGGVPSPVVPGKNPFRYPGSIFRCRFSLSIAKSDASATQIVLLIPSETSTRRIARFGISTPPPEILPFIFAEQQIFSGVPSSPSSLVEPATPVYDGWQAAVPMETCRNAGMLDDGQRIGETRTLSIACPFSGAKTGCPAFQVFRWSRR